MGDSINDKIDEFFKHCDEDNLETSIGQVTAPIYLRNTESIFYNGAGGANIVE